MILFFDVLLTVHLSVFISVINQLDAQNFCFTVSLFNASTCFEHMCCGWVGVVSVLQHVLPATRLPLQPNHTETPHFEPRTIRPMW